MEQKLGMQKSSSSEELTTRLMNNSSAIAILCAMEFGYKAHERGINLEQTREELLELLKERT